MYIWDVLENRTRKMSTKEFFDFNGGSWRSYYRDLVRGSFLNEVYFKFEEIEKSIAVLEEDGEILKLKMETGSMFAGEGSSAESGKSRMRKSVESWTCTSAAKHFEF